jgi:hypothetical protein
MNFLPVTTVERPWIDRNAAASINVRGRGA